MSRPNQQLEELYKTTLENLKHMKELIIEEARNDKDSSKYDKIIQDLNAQYNSCKEQLDKLYGFK